MARVDLEAINNGTTVHLTTPPEVMLVLPGSTPSFSQRPLREVHHTLRPGEFKYFLLWANMSLASWLENYEAEQAESQLLNESPCEIFVSDVLDEGIRDRSSVRVGGVPFHPNQATAGVWHPAPGALKSAAIHAERIYYRSRRRGLTLDDPE